MRTVQQHILEHSRRLPEGSVLAPKSLLHLGSRPAIDQALSRLTRSGELLRIGRGRYVRPQDTRFGRRLPSARHVVEQVSRSSGEIVAPSGAAEALALGWSTQVPVRTVYLTSGRSRRLELGRQVIELRHAPRWKLWGAGTREGAVLRAVEWLGREVPHDVVEQAVSILTPAERARLVSACASMPTWLAKRLTDALHSREGARVSPEDG